MRRIACLGLGVAVVAASLAADQPRTSGENGYRVLGELAVQHSGRIKPLDTYARQTVKHVYTREIIKLRDLKGEEVGRWEPLAALLDWQARPDFWNAQEIIAFEYLPLKQKLISVPAREALAELAKSGKLSAADQASVEKAAKDPNVTTADLKAAAVLPGVPDALAAKLKTLAHKISPDQKWLAPQDLDEGRLVIDGQEVAFTDWIAQLAMRRPERPDLGEEQAKYTEIEKKALEGAQKLATYMSSRDGNPKGDPFGEIFVIPRPHSPAHLTYTRGIIDRLRAADKGHQGKKSFDDLTEFEDTILRGLSNYHKDLKAKDRKVPGDDAEFDAAYAEWLRDKSAWLSLRLILTVDVKELSAAGLEESKVLAVRKAYLGVIEGEKVAPGHLPVEKAQALVSATRDLGESVSVAYLLKKDAKHKTWNDLKPDRVAAFTAVRDPLAASSTPLPDEKKAELLNAARSVSTNLVAYPPSAEMGRETSFNYFAPFYKAQMAYGLGLVLLLLTLGASRGPNTSRSPIEKGLYTLGMLGFVSGIGLEVIGFYYRVRISGWAPVTNMYETVVWVALVTSVLGLVLEAIYRKTYAAAAASGMALLATVLAANVSLLDPDIQNLQPVLRSNYWLTIHVLTIVSSYAAFALAMGLGLLAIGYYLSATYRRDVPYGTLAKPLIPSVPMLLIGVAGLMSIQNGWIGSGSPSAMSVYLLGTVAMFGLMGTIVAVFGLIGESSSRVPYRTTVAGALLMVAGVAGIAGVPYLDSPTWWPQTISLFVPPAVIAGLGLTVILLSRMGALARGAMVEAQVKHSTAELADLPAAATSTTTSYASEGGSVGTLTKPSVAEIRARQEASLPRLDPRGLSMQATAGRIKPLSNFAYRAMQVGVLLVAAGTILGGVWADVSWGRFWGWDAKEVWALITLLVYLVPLHGRFAGWVNTFGLIASTVVCFSAVLMAWYGVNFVLSTGLHTYGFAEGGGQGIVLTISLSVLAVVAATWRRRSLASMV
ncbi:MAG: ABC-type transport system involved in cytochrome c biosis, permease component [Planctomycetota bacterium]|nr:ABC-type transport system involved in cytochrome c biosis, permease component [Planctomycetota bacterium]